jgi:hypothetical protein
MNAIGSINIAELSVAPRNYYYGTLNKWLCFKSFECFTVIQR